MRKEVTTVTIHCDLCKEELKAPSKWITAGDFDICKECFDALQLEGKRVFEGLVPSRRGGFRQLGEYDG